MGKLDADRRALPLHERDQRLEAFDLGIAPDAEIMLVDEPDFLHARRLDEDETKTAERIAAEMHQMEGTAGIAGLGAIMDHRRYDEAVLQREPANFQRLEQLWMRGPATIGWCVTHWRFSFANRDGLPHVTMSSLHQPLGFLATRR